MIVFRLLFALLKGIWITFWCLYQLALGALLIAMLWGLWQAAQYFHVFAIRDLRHENPKTTAFIEIERIRLKDSLLAAEERLAKTLPDTSIRYRFIAFDSIPKAMREMALVAEDAKFYSHSGFDFEEIEYALVANHQQGRKARGASTISQQVAKNLFLKADKEMSRKLREAALTFLLEETLTKDRILELYLNIAQFGPGVFGLAEGAQYHYGKPLQALTPEEQLGLICLLPSPLKWNPKRGQTAYLMHKRRVVGNYALYRGLRDRSDSTQNGWLIGVYDSLARRLNDEKWEKLRTSSGLGFPLDSSTADTVMPQAVPGQPPRTF
jgi:monofunctional glycosyltransferase